MKQTVTEQTFKQAFIDMNRKNNFSEEGLDVLFEALEQYEEDTGEEVELDVIALCCEYTEFESFAEFQENYDNIDSMSTLEDNTVVIDIPSSDAFIIQDF